MALLAARSGSVEVQGRVVARYWIELAGVESAWLLWTVEAVAVVTPLCEATIESNTLCILYEVIWSLLIIMAHCMQKMCC